MAEGVLKAGHEVMFFSFSRPYFIAFKHEERLNKTVLRELSEGKIYNVGNNGKSLINFTWPTLRAPQPFHRYMPARINRWLQTHSFTSFKTIQKKFLKGTDVFVFESCDGVELLDLIRRYNPNAKIVYRPSDPLMVDGCSAEMRRLEEKLMRTADMSFIVNKAGLKIYEQKISDFNTTVKYQLLPNGVNVDLFKCKYPKPKEINCANTFLYVGARVIEWDLIKQAAIERPDYNFIIVCPEKHPDGFTSVPNNNIKYIPGIKPSEVPAWVTNCDVVIVPNPTGWYKIKPWGITAKYYQAMEARRPIVAYEDTDELTDYGVFVAHDYESFISMLDKALTKKNGIDYQFKAMDWDMIAEVFNKSISDL